MLFPRKEDVMFLSGLSKIVTLNFALGSTSYLFSFPPLVGYIIAGVILGPFVTKNIASPHSLSLFNDVSNTGLILLMFYTGMEVDIQNFFDKKKGASFSILAVFLQFISTSVK